jgi:hypothetical protein
MNNPPFIVHRSSFMEISPTGTEPINVTSKYTKALRRFNYSRVAKSDALDPTLQELIDAWPNLPEAIRGAILVMVCATIPK